MTSSSFCSAGLKSLRCPVCFLAIANQPTHTSPLERAVGPAEEKSHDESWMILEKRLASSRPCPLQWEYLICAEEVHTRIQVFIFNAVDLIPSATSHVETNRLALTSVFFFKSWRGEKIIEMLALNCCRQKLQKNHATSEGSSEDLDVSFCDMPWGLFESSHYYGLPWIGLQLDYSINADG